MTSLRASIGAGLVFLCTLASAAPPDGVRALLRRADDQAQVARLHPEAARLNAEAAARFARQAGGRAARDPGLRPEGRALERAAENLRSAARRREDAAVRASAIEVSLRACQLDAALATSPER